MREDYDGAEAVAKFDRAWGNLLRLAQISGREAWQARADSDPQGIQHSVC